VVLKSSRQVRLLVDGRLSGARNMAIDEALALLATTPTLRAYRFGPPAVTLGRFQAVPEGASYLERMAASGIDVVRRPTGGRAILHQNDFTYSAVFTSGEGGTPSREDVFHEVALCIVETLCDLGIGARMAEHGEHEEHEAEWCFESAFGVDIECRGRKICGSAQRVFGEAILQHGSLYLDDAPLLAAAKCGFITLRDAGGRDYAWEEVLAALVRGFEKTLGAELLPGRMTDAEGKLAHSLELEKYGTEQWLKDGCAERDV